MTILKCPFCGSDAVLENLYNMDFFVQCIKHECQAHGPFKDTQEKAVNSWNTRVFDGLKLQPINDEEED